MWNSIISVLLWIKIWSSMPSAKTLCACYVTSEWHKITCIHYLQRMLHLTMPPKQRLNVMLIHITPIVTWFYRKVYLKHLIDQELLVMAFAYLHCLLLFFLLTQWACSIRLLLHVNELCECYDCTFYLFMFLLIFYLFLVNTKTNTIAYLYTRGLAEAF